MKISRLISGTDLRGKALGEGAEMTKDVAFRVGAAFATALAQSCGHQPKVNIGRDSRLTGPDLLDACAKGMMSAGADVTAVNLCTTPAMFMSLIAPGWGGDGAVMVTASHMPSQMNGLKMILPTGGLDHDWLLKIVHLAESDEALDRDGGCIRQADFLPAYCALLAQRVYDALGHESDQPLQGLHVAVDAGNGAGGFYAEFLKSMGADITGSVNLEPDGRFPVHIPNPEDPAAMDAVSHAVTEAGADLGVIFDADCDRAAIVEADGREINRNRLIALISAVLLQKEKGITIVTDSVTSSGLRDFIALKGGTQYRFKRGYRNVIDEAIRLNKSGMHCPLAIETSGHAALEENHFLDDGMYLVTVLICEAVRMKRQGGALGNLIADLKEPCESKEIRLKITVDDFRNAGQAVIDHLNEQANSIPGWHIAPDNREGIRISYDCSGEADSAWFLLRLSVHDPVMPLNLESDLPGGCRKMAQDLLELLENESCLDLTALEEYAC